MNGIRISYGCYIRKITALKVSLETVKEHIWKKFWVTPLLFSAKANVPKSVIKKKRSEEASDVIPSRSLVTVDYLKLEG